MLKLKKLLHREGIRLPLVCLTSAGSGYLLSVGTVCGLPSVLAVVLAGIVQPMMSFCILAGSVIAYLVQGAPEEMRFLLAFLLLTAGLRLLLLEVKKPHLLAVLTAFSGIAAAFAADLFFTRTGGLLPLYVLEALAAGAGVYFLADARDAVSCYGRICLDAGKGFTFAMAYLLSITGLCGVDLRFCNLGRIAGITVTLLAARKFRHSGGTLLGSLTACGITLCSPSLGMPLLFLPVTGMLAGFLSNLPNAVLIPVFFVMQFLSSYVFDGSMELARVLAEMLIGCCLFGIFSHMDLEKIICLRRTEPAAVLYLPRREQFLSEAFLDLRNETSSVMRRLRPAEPEKGELAARKALCTGCRNEVYCWEQRREQTQAAFRQLFHHPDLHPRPEALDGCLRINKMTECFLRCSRNAAMTQLKNVHLHESRAGLLQYLQILEEMTAACGTRQQIRICEAETQQLRDILHTCGCNFTECFVRCLKSGRYAAEVYTREAELPVSAIREMLSDSLEVPMQEIPAQQSGKSRRFCFCQKPPYSLEISMQSVNAPHCRRCGDSAASATDGEGNVYLILSDGMGSGDNASLTSRLAVHTFTQMIACGFSADSTIRLINTMLLSETGTEHFTTLDILRMDADTGSIQIWKSGAAATLFCHHKKVIRIAASSFPVGILTEAEPFRRKLCGNAQDRIIMLSDGIDETEFSFIRELLLQDMPMDKLAGAICEKAGLYSRQEDDVTVIAASVHCTAPKLSARANHRSQIPQPAMPPA